jgi:hypothetical protein
MTAPMTYKPAGPALYSTLESGEHDRECSSQGAPPCF